MPLIDQIVLLVGSAVLMAVIGAMGWKGRPKR